MFRLNLQQQAMAQQANQQMMTMMMTMMTGTVMQGNNKRHNTNDGNENDGNEGSTSFVESTKQNDRSIIENEGSVIDDIDGEERIGAEDCSDIDETNNEIAMSKEDKNSVQV